MGVESVVVTSDLQRVRDVEKAIQGVETLFGQGRWLLCSLASALAGLALLVTACGKSVTSVDPFRFDQVLDPAPIVRITSAGVTPQVSHLARAVVVRFVNEDSVAHRLTAAPELGYGACPEMEALGVLRPGASGALTVDRPDAYCAFHDQSNPASFPFQGILVVH